ncbi:MAG: divergent polysaccharide deacetylase family protein [Candidatus Omnitrophota bacterium]|nr:divergent polysaccharide deacetylase family protein [Candidatus Omnitrophota bacterium]
MPLKEDNLKLKTEAIIISVLVCLLIVETALLIRFWPKKPKVVERPEVLELARIAIILDDWGYNYHNLNFLKAIDIPLDISVLPFLPYSKKIAKEANLNNKEVMLHLPLEPHPNSQIRLENKVILTAMPKEEVLQILSEALKSVPFCRGINNHMGSLATEKRNLMTIIFKEMRKRKLFFVDSLVTTNSICQELAEELELKFAQRSIFLDNENDADYIRRQLMLLAKRAKRQGSAIGIGHDRRLTLQVIKEIAPEIKKQGIKFVFVSELVK